MKSPMILCQEEKNEFAYSKLFQVQFKDIIAILEFSKKVYEFANADFSKIKWSAYSRWSFGSNSAWGSVETMTKRKTHPTLLTLLSSNIFKLVKLFLLFLKIKSGSLTDFGMTRISLTGSESGFYNPLS